MIIHIYPQEKLRTAKTLNYTSKTPKVIVGIQKIVCLYQINKENGQRVTNF